MKFNLSRFIEVVDRLGPAVLSVVPGGDKIAPLVPKIVAGIKEAQQIAGASGADKKKHVLATIAAGADVAKSAGVKISPAEVNAIASKGIDAVIEAVHVVEGAKATRPDEPAAAVGFEHGGIAGAPGSVPGVDTAPKSSDLGGGKATHGHGSSDDPPPAPATGKTPAPGTSKS